MPNLSLSFPPSESRVCSGLRGPNADISFADSRKIREGSLKAAEELRLAAGQAIARALGTISIT